jgi:RNA polymerase primary sigma factor
MGNTARRWALPSSMALLKGAERQERITLDKSSGLPHGAEEDEESPEGFDPQEAEQFEQSLGFRSEPDDLGNRYLQWVARRSKCLTAHDEVQLAKQLEAGDARAKERLILSNLKLVLAIAKRYTGRGTPFMDLVQEGNLGLVKAVERYNWRLGYRFSTYACWWIRQGVLQAFSEHDRVIRLPGHVIDDLNRLNKAQTQLEESLQRQPLVTDLASKLGLSIRKVERLLQHKHKPYSLESDNSGGGDSGEEDQRLSLSEILSDPQQEAIADVLWTKQALRQLLEGFDSVLNGREQDILRKRFALQQEAEKPMTLEAIGQEYGLTRESIRQSEKKALSKLRTLLVQYL